MKMKKFNLATERIAVDKKPLLHAINSGKIFGITTEGEVVYEPFDTAKRYIWQGSMQQPTSALQPRRTLAQLFGPTYKIEESGEQVTIDAADAWNEIVPFNRAGALYDDTTVDGVMDFADETLEDMSWHAVEFGVTNRDIADAIEEACEGTLYCVHKEEPFFFSALVYVDDLEQAREAAKRMIVAKIEEKLANDPDYAPELLDEDQEEAARYFGVLE